MAFLRARSKEFLAFSGARSGSQLLSSDACITQESSQRAWRTSGRGPVPTEAGARSASPASHASGKTPSRQWNGSGHISVFPVTSLLKSDKPRFELRFPTHFRFILGKSQLLRASVSSSREGVVTRIRRTDERKPTAQGLASSKCLVSDSTLPSSACFPVAMATTREPNDSPRFFCHGRVVAQTLEVHATYPRSSQHPRAIRTGATHSPTGRPEGGSLSSPSNPETRTPSC